MNSNSKTFIRSITALAAMLTVTAALAANGTTPLSDCVDRVVAACNQGSHPVPCTNNGIDQCEEVYGAQIAGLQLTLIPPTFGQTREHVLLAR